MIGTIIGNYRVVRELGQGGMGAVYEGIDIMVERPVAIKMLRAEIAENPDVIERFRVEAVTLARLNHPCIATLYSFFREGKDYYMVMEFVRGETMESRMRRLGRLAPEYAAEILAQTLDGMAHAHVMGVLHRDIKPANIMITREGRVKVTDFGIARVLGSSRMTRDGRIIGTLEYLAPERIRGEEADVRSDLYSVGIVLYEAVSGRLPFTANTDYELMQAHLNQAPPALTAAGIECPPWVHSILKRALAKSREDRFQSPEEFRDALAAADPNRITQSGLASTAVRVDLKTTRREQADVSGADRKPGALMPLLKKLPLRPIGFAAGGLVVLIGLFLVIDSYRFTRTENPTTVATLPQPVPPDPQLPSREAPPQQTLPAETGRLLPLERFQNRPVLEPPREPIGSGDRATKTGVIKSVAIPVQPDGEESSAVAEAPHETPPPARASVAEPATPNADPPEPAAAGAMTLQDVRRIFVEKMPDQLDAYIKSEIDKQLLGRVRLVARREDADAVLQGGRDEYSGSATLMDLKGNVLLWKDEAGDGSSVLGITKRGGPKKIAERLVTSLKKKMNY